MKYGPEVGGTPPRSLFPGLKIVQHPQNIASLTDGCSLAGWSQENSAKFHDPKQENSPMFFFFVPLCSRTSPICSAHIVMSSVLWAIRRLQRGTSSMRSAQKAPGVHPRSKLSQSFSRSSKALANTISRVSIHTRRYTTSTRGVEVAKEFEEWINAIPTQQKNVRRFTAPYLQFSSQTRSNRMEICEHYGMDGVLSNNALQYEQNQGRTRRRTNRECGGRK